MFVSKLLKICLLHSSTQCIHSSSYLKCLKPILQFDQSFRVASSFVFLCKIFTSFLKVLVLFRPFDLLKLLVSIRFEAIETFFIDRRSSLIFWVGCNPTLHNIHKEPAVVVNIEIFFFFRSNENFYF